MKSSTLRRSLLVAFCAAVSLTGNPASAAEQFALQTNLDHVWTMTAAGLVFFMQAGFMLLEAGSVRSKNSVNVAQKNLIDFLLSTLCYGTIGFAIMFGTTHDGWFGWDASLAIFGNTEDWSMTFFVFQLVFCGTAATIVSGAVAERMRMDGYILCTVLIALVIYPVVGHWAWGGLLNGQDGPWLADMGFMDFAGGTVVHSVGGWVALAAIIILGPRSGKFDKDGHPVTLHGHSPILATVGCLIIWVGWIGFNGGSTTAGTSDFANIVQNTMICGGIAGATTMLLGRILQGHMTPAASINGVLGGLVAVTPGCDVLDGQSAMMLGGIAGVVVLLSEKVLEYFCKLDDPLGAVSVHGVCGALGTVLLAVFADADLLLASSRWEQVYVQLVGVGSVFLWTFGVAFCVLWLVSKVFAPEGGGSGLRVPRHYEEIGLNVAEHKAPLGTGVLQAALQDIALNSNAGFTPIEVERGDEAYEMAELINKIMGDLHSALGSMEMCVEAASAGDFSARIDTTSFTGTPLRLCEGFNQINTVCETGLRLIRTRVEALAEGDIHSPAPTGLEGEFKALCAALTAATGHLSQTIDQIATSAKQAERGGASIAQTSTTLNEQTGTLDQNLSDALPVLEEIRDTSASHSDLAAEAAALCETACDSSRAGQTLAQEAVALITDAKHSTEDIVGFVDVIEDIARQINLLAVNARVEAARGTTDAAAAAKSFKVLAEEVRNLAEHTRSTVAQVREKSTQVFDTVAQGNEKVCELNDSLAGILELTGKTVRVSNEVQTAGGAQQERIETISAALTDLRQHATQTRQLAQNSKDEAVGLCGDAQRTSQMLAFFEPEENGAPCDFAKVA